VPFARYVAMNHHNMAFPFRRYQIQPVWRADRPQKGRYREFYQCDADIIGTDSLWSELDLLKIYDSAFHHLGFKDVEILINNRKLLAGVAEHCGCENQFVEMTIALDKLDKVGWEGVEKELAERGVSSNSIAQLRDIIELKEKNVDQVLEIIKFTEVGTKGVEEFNFLREALSGYEMNCASWKWDLTLARGLNYYTGFIFEVKALGIQMGSIGGGGRYDNLTDIFGLPNMSGVGISFGADRIYDVMEELHLFPETTGTPLKLGFAYFSEETIRETQRWADGLRNEGISCEVYPSFTKMKKQFKWADDKKIPFMAVMGEEELKQGLVSLKNLQTGDQAMLTFHDLLNQLKSSC
jgi:histidyl-tRNA synthetase